ncbi:MAG: hypothetical protein JXP73_02940 [Deltaproteobacteria bacterium]|nr:hypothetical protein [Deltaproteobacteria bacterium]
MNRLPLSSDWRLTFGTQLPRGVLVLLLVAAFLAVAISAFALWRERRRGRTLALLALRLLAVLACLMVAFEPRLEFGQVTAVPNYVAVLVDASRSMRVAPPDRGPTRAERSAALLASAAGTFSAWEGSGHKIEFYGFGEALEPASRTAPPEPTGEATRTAEALAELRTRFAGRDLAAVVLVSDGIDNGRIGRGPLDADTRKTLEALAAPVHTVRVGEPELRDLSVAAVLADDFAFVRTPVKLEAVLRHSGLGGRVVEVSLLRDARTIAAKAVLLRKESAQEKVLFDFTPDRPGNYVFEIRTPVLSGEALQTNNSQVFTLKVIRDRVRVLHVCGRPSWNERFLRSMLRLNPNVDLVSFFILRTDTDEMPLGRDEMSLIPFPYKEIFDEQLKSFDLLIFDNFNYKPYWVGPYLPGVRAYIEGGGALAMVGGDLSFASGLYGESELQAVLPVALASIPREGPGAWTGDSYRPRLTAAGRTHPVTALDLEAKANAARWARLPPLVGMNRVAGLRSGARALLVHPSHKSKDGKPAPVLATAQVGRGRSLALLTDSAWLWGFGAAGAGDDGRAFQRFWEGAIRWLVRDPALALLRLDLDRVEYRRGQSALLRTRTLRSDFSAAPAVEVALELRRAESADGGDPLLDFKLVTGADGESHTDLGGLAPGAYRLTGRAALDGRGVEVETTFVVRPEGREFDDVVARDKVLREIAQASGGEFHDGALGSPPVRPPRKVRVGSSRTIEIWSNPLVLLLALALLGAEWTLRRRTGHA